MLYHSFLDKLPEGQIFGADLSLRLAGGQGPICGFQFLAQRYSRRYLVLRFALHVSQFLAWFGFVVLVSRVEWWSLYWLARAHSMHSASHSMVRPARKTRGLGRYTRGSRIRAPWISYLTSHTHVHNLHDRLPPPVRPRVEAAAPQQVGVPAIRHGRERRRVVARGRLRRRLRWW